MDLVEHSKLSILCNLRKGAVPRLALRVLDVDHAAAYRTRQPATADDALVSTVRSFMGAVLFAPRAAMGAALTMSRTTADEPVRRTPQALQVCGRAALRLGPRSSKTWIVRCQAARRRMSASDAC